MISQDPLKLVVWMRDEARYLAIGTQNVEEVYNYAYSISRHLLTTVYPELRRAMGQEGFSQLMWRLEEEEKTNPTEKLQLIKLGALAQTSYKKESN